MSKILKIKDDTLIEFFNKLKDIYDFAQKNNLGKGFYLNEIYTERICNDIFNTVKSDKREFDTIKCNKYYEVKATMDAKGQTSINLNHKFDYLVWIYFDFDNSKIKIYRQDGKSFFEAISNNNVIIDKEKRNNIQLGKYLHNTDLYGEVKL